MLCLPFVDESHSIYICVAHESVECTFRCGANTQEVYMGLLEDAFKGWTGLAVGLGAAYAAPALAPAIGPIVRPFAKGLIKTGLMVAHSVREYTAEAYEELGDLYAEARAETSARANGEARSNGEAADHGQPARRSARRR